MTALPATLLNMIASPASTTPKTSEEGGKGDDFAAAFALIENPDGQNSKDAFDLAFGASEQDQTNGEDPARVEDAAIMTEDPTVIADGDGAALPAKKSESAAPEIAAVSIPQVAKDRRMQPSNPIFADGKPGAVPPDIRRPDKLPQTPGLALGLGKAEQMPAASSDPQGEGSKAAPAQPDKRPLAPGLRPDLPVQAEGKGQLARPDIPRPPTPPSERPAHPVAHLPHPVKPMQTRAPGLAKDMPQERGDLPLPTRRGLESRPVASMAAPAEQAVTMARPVADVTSPLAEKPAFDPGPMGPMPVEGRGTAPASPNAAPPSAAHTGPESARHVAGQMALALVQSREGKAELALSPRELGRVRMTLSTRDSAITLVVQAERPETSDLMRRHIDTLSQEFREMGFTDIRFDFRDGRGAAQGHVHADPTTEPEDIMIPELVEATDRAPVSTSGLDLRL